jgi:cytochrome oxidase Cu insertion factor (SCO1/SenC/PrrC family)
MSHALDDAKLPLVFLGAWLAITVMWWALAFFPLPATPPEWLVLARQVCFGSTPTGLPAGYGWLGLFGVPGLMLGFLVVVWGRQLRANLQALGRTTSGTLVIGVLVAVPLVGAVWVGQRVVTATRVTEAFTPASRTVALPEHYPRLDRPAPEIHLLDQHGRMTSLAEHRGETIMLTFAFGHCQTICPAVVQTAREAVEATTDVLPGLWIVTLDPWRDTPGALAGLAARWRLNGGNVRLLSAEVDDVLAVLDAYEVPRQRNLKTGAITHPALVYIIDANGRIAYAFTNPSRSWLVEAVSRTAAPEAS